MENLQSSVHFPRGAIASDCCRLLTLSQPSLLQPLCLVRQEVGLVLYLMMNCQGGLPTHFFLIFFYIGLLVFAKELRYGTIPLHVCVYTSCSVVAKFILPGKIRRET